MLKASPLSRQEAAGGASGRIPQQRREGSFPHRAESGRPPALSQGSRGSILTAQEAEKLERGLPEENHLVSFEQVYVRHLNNRPPCGSLPESAYP